MDKIAFKTKYYKLRKEDSFCIVSNYNLELFFLDSLSSNIYLKIDASNSVSQIVDAIYTMFHCEVKKEQILNDVIDFIKKMCSLDLLEASNE